MTVKACNSNISYYDIFVEGISDVVLAKNVFCVRIFDMLYLDHVIKT